MSDDWYRRPDPAVRGIPFESTGGGLTPRLPGPPLTKQAVRMAGRTDCPHCGAPNNAHAGDGMPQTGAWSICYSCHRISRFVNTGGELTLRKATASELVEFAQDFPDDARVLSAGYEDLAAAVATLNPPLAVGDRVWLPTPLDETHPAYKLQQQITAEPGTIVSIDQTGFAMVEVDRWGRFGHRVEDLRRA